MKRQVIVIGSGVGGLSAAIHARILGHDVLVLEQSSSAGGKAAGIAIAGYKLDPGPSIIILKRLYDDVFRRAGRQIDDYLAFKRLDPFTRVYFEGAEPLDLPADRGECLRLLKDRFPEDAGAFSRLMTQLDGIMPLVNRSIFSRPYDQPWHLLDPKLIRMGRALGIPKKYKAMVDAWFQSPVIRAFFYGFPSYGGQTYDSVAPGALFIPYLMLAEGVYYPVGGVSAIPKALAQLALDLGVQFQFGGHVTGLRTNKRQIDGVITKEGVTLCDAVISNVDRFTTGKWLGRHFDHGPSLSYFTVHLGVSRLVPGLSHHTLFIPQDFEVGFEQLYRQRKFPDSPIVYVNATHLEDPLVAPPGHSNLFAVVTSPAMEPNIDWKKHTDIAKEKTFSVLSKFGYDFEADEVDFERVQTPEYFQQNHGNYLGSLYGPDEKHRLFGMMPNRNWDEEFSNLFYCGGSVQPGAGLPMATLSGKFAADRLGSA